MEKNKKFKAIKIVSIIVFSLSAILILFNTINSTFLHNKNTNTKKNVALVTPNIHEKSKNDFIKQDMPSTKIDNAIKVKDKMHQNSSSGSATNKSTSNTDIATNNNSSTTNEAQPDSSKASQTTMDTDSFDAELVPKVINKTYVNDGKKVACLTFDDGPSTTVTPNILDVLNKYNVKATFFLIGNNIDKNETSMNLVKQLLHNGHSIGNHTYTHEASFDNPSSLYYRNTINIDRYFTELDQTNNSLKRILGKNFYSRIIRMPGGHMTRVHSGTPNLNAFDEKLRQNGIINIDWNAYDIDAEGPPKLANQLVKNAIASIGNKEKVILLMHDTYGKEETAKALPFIIEYLKAHGYEFKKIK